MARILDWDLRGGGFAEAYAHAGIPPLVEVREEPSYPSDPGTGLAFYPAADGPDATVIVVGVTWDGGERLQVELTADDLRTLMRAVEPTE